MRIDTARLATALTELWPDVASSSDKPAPPERLAAWLSAAAEVTLAQDSRQVEKGDLFLAVPGVSVDGREFISRALDAGAAGVLCEAEGLATAWATDERVLALPGLTSRLAALGRRLFAVPESLQLIGVTGTNGKSSVTYYIATLLEALGTPAAVIGTLGYGRPGDVRAAVQTTPGPLALQQMLGELASDGVEVVAMEVSSHALAQERLGDTRVDAAVFTNLSRDHLDYHGSMAAYAAAKARLFRRGSIRLAVVNGDDPLARLMLAGLPDGIRVLASGGGEATTLRVVDCEALPNGLRAIVATPENEGVLELALMGRFNLDNALLAIATLHGLGYPLASLWQAASALQPVPGRMQRLPRDDAGKAPVVVVDYAHTPDALENALSALRDHLPGRQGSALWCVFGCGGDRDSGKRPLMAAIAEKLADRIVVTDDNPRSEDPQTIRDQIAAGLSPEARAESWSVEGREAAIERVIAAAGDEDIVLIAGKGHEDYQEVAGIRQPFSDVEVASRCLRLRETSA
ncbi:UDP-N-acetylmuramoyl-L-alanyl-D-glutamate--2,6-diaminopimelate ligase [Salinicola acroporae]|uniref:UDP-N-acetylmuramoyl-L-alanyl-D-glutamate--2,6-diaminopimelate ligase n=1 Tax=Salinicola acroporae TaxID=1541440 RepID=A0ABT6I7R9_9GAMM|nr:UDP-N-acetylmuramoyl-L-alanyl-D-glutamate--2,6-diaminopimelate ligase [Salinicola acroporae]MDH4573568.1 UDP-N-acetylmuramoyl-L-alanyl-D-glutamate--2,6-diaminopimelate ligase [Salinicola acroporae]